MPKSLHRKARFQFQTWKIINLHIRKIPCSIAAFLCPNQLQFWHFGILSFLMQNTAPWHCYCHNVKVLSMPNTWRAVARHLYYNCTKEGWILCSRQKKYELLENMKNPSYIGQNKYENLEEPSRTSHTRSSYFFNPLVKSCQIFILIQSPS